MYKLIDNQIIRRLKFTINTSKIYNLLYTDSSTTIQRITKTKYEYYLNEYDLVHIPFSSAIGWKNCLEFAQSDI